MPKKLVKLPGGRTVEIYAVRLPNGRVVVPSRMEHDRTIGYWKEVPATSSEAKFYSKVTLENEPDPRDEPDYDRRMKAIMGSAEYRTWAQSQKKRKK